MICASYVRALYELDKPPSFTVAGQCLGIVGLNSKPLKARASSGKSETINDELNLVFKYQVTASMTVQIKLTVKPNKMEILMRLGNPATMRRYDAGVTKRRRNGMAAFEVRKSVLAAIQDFLYILFEMQMSVGSHRCPGFSDTMC